MYKTIKKKYSAETIIYTPSLSKGDYFIFRCFMESAFKINSINSYCTPCEYSIKKFAIAFAYKNIEPLSSIDYISLVFFLNYTGEKNTLNMFTWTVTDYTNSNKDILKINIEYPKIPDDQVKQLFFDNNLKIGNTVVLSPYEQTITLQCRKKLSYEFWFNLAKRLKEKSYTVCTNCANNSLEPCIKGTIPIFCSYEEIAKFVDSAGIVIGIRSGFMDIVSLTNCYKIVLYPDNNFIESYSLTKVFGIEKNIKEYVYANYNYNELIDIICKNIEVKIL